MPKSTVFAATHHDPQGLLNAQAQRLLPLLKDLYLHMVVVVTSATSADTQAFLKSEGVCVYDRGTGLPETNEYLGHWRRKSVELSLQEAPTATHIHFCDFDRLLHWADYYQDELCTVLDIISDHDFTVLGRTPRAFATHPRVQRDTEAIINHVFHTVSGLPWDVTAASRGFSRRAAELLVAGSEDDTIGNDCSWPLFFQRHGNMRLHFMQTEGLEFETLDRYSAQELAAVGGVDGWLARLDTDPQQWAQRLETARLEVAAMIPYGAEA
jgi:hypothetical protein